MRSGNGLWRWAAPLLIGLLTGLSSYCVQAVNTQTVNLTGSIDNGTCNLGMKIGTSNTVDFQTVNYSLFANAGPGSTLPAGTNNGTVMNFSLALSNCVTTAGGAKRPGIQVDTTDYHADGMGDYGRLWRGAGSTADGVGYMVQFGDVSDATPATWWNSTYLKGNDIVNQGAAGTAQANDDDIPFSVIMTCGLCKTPVTEGSVTASLTFTFAYR